jgi:S-adenosylmethionine:tRNA ribosyltransferase-isomerase
MTATERSDLDRSAAYDYRLPPELIAQTPAEPRHSARLLVLDRRSGRIEHRRFSDLAEILAPNDLVVANRSRVLPARLVGRRVPTGGRVEALLLRQVGPSSWETLLRPGRRLDPGARIRFERDGCTLDALAGERLADGRRKLEFEAAVGPDRLSAVGLPPLPPYIRNWRGDPERYQTVYGDQPGSAAAPTAGLHFSSEVLERLEGRGIDFRYVTLHVGPDTFRPLQAEQLADHQMHAEWVSVEGETLGRIAQTRRRGGRAVIVGTTTVRALESAAAAGPGSEGWSGWTSLFIRPGHRFLSVDALITNFHLPRSTLLVLVSAFASREQILAAYAEAIRERYRFFSFGDAMLIL